MKGKLIFEEEQKFVGTWTWYLLLSITAFSVVPGVYILSTMNEKETGLISIGIVLLVMTGVIVLHVAMRLKVTIDRSAIYYRFPPFVRTERKLDKSDIQAINVRKYQPIWEFGGHGYRFRFGSGRAMSVAGKHGLQLILSNGKRLLIGTQKPEELERAISQLKENWSTVEDNG